MYSITPNLIITVPRSRYLTISLLFCTIGSFFIIYSLSLNILTKLAIALIVLIYSAYLYLHHIRSELPYSCVKIQLLQKVEWMLQLSNGKIDSGILRADTYVSSWLIIFRFQTRKPWPFNKISILLFAKEVDSELWRKLNIYLRWQAQKYLNPTILIDNEKSK